MPCRAVLATVPAAHVSACGLAAQSALLREKRGTGFFYALEFMGSRAEGRDLTDEETAGLQGGVLARLVREAGLLIRPDDRGATMLTYSPPLIADRTVIDDIIDRSDQVLTRATAWLAGER